MTEEFRDIPGYEGMYKISNRGEVVSYICSVRPIIRQHNFKPGRQHYVTLSRDKVVKRLNVAKLVAQAFNLPNPNHYKYILPKDGNPGNLNIDNLEWVKCHNKTAHTPEAEAKRAKTWKRKREDGYRPSSKFFQNRNRSVSAYDDEDCWVATFRSLAVASKLTGANSIGQALAKGCKSGGYYWKYAERAES